MRLIVPCPIAESEYAGWAKQVRSIFNRIDNLCVEYIYKPNIVFFGPKFCSFLYLVKAVFVVVFNRSSSVVLFPSFFILNVFVSLVAGIAGIPFLVRISGGELRKGNSLAYKLRISRIKKASGVIVLNNNDYKFLLGLGVTESRISLIYNPVGDLFHKPSLEQREKSRKIFNFPDSKIVLGTVGTVCYRKGQIDLVSAISFFPPDLRSNIVLFICGPSKGHPEADPVYARDCFSIADQFAIECIFLENSESINSVLWACDFYVQPSYSEGMPNALLEAMACGLVCVGSNIPGVNDVIKDRVNGFLFDAGDIEGLADVLKAVIVSNNDLNEISHLAQHTIAKNHSPRIVDEKYFSAISNVLGE